jgi:hypothetical protein
MARKASTARPPALELRAEGGKTMLVPCPRRKPHPKRPCRPSWKALEPPRVVAYVPQTPDILKVMRAALRRAARRVWPFGRRPPDDEWPDEEPARVPVGPPRRPRPASSVALEPPLPPVRVDAHAGVYAKRFIRRLLRR